MKKIISLMMLLIFLASIAYGHTRASDIEWGLDVTSSLPSQTLAQWTKGVDARIGVMTNTTCYYVNSNVLTEGDGSSWNNAKDTLNEAIDLCEDGNEVIYVAAGHTETMGAAADEVDVDVDGVVIYGIGQGLEMPLFDYTASITGAFAVGADNVTFYNIRWHANVTDVNEAVEIEAGSAGVTFIDCVFDVESEGTDDFLECIDSSGGAASDRLAVIGCKFYMGAGTCNAAICTKDSDYMRVIGNEFYGDCATATINNLTTASNHVLIKENILFQGTIGGNAGLNTEPCIELVNTTTGVICNNYLACNLATKAASIVAADCFLFENYYNEDESSAGTGGIIGTASADD
jgi:hypothetical protein